MKLIFWISLIILIYYSTSKETANKFDDINVYGGIRVLLYVLASLLSGLIIGLPVLMIFELVVRIFM